MFKKLLVVVCAVLFLASAGNVMAGDFDGPGYFIHSQTGAVKWFDKHPGEPSQWRFCEECGSQGEFEIQANAFGAGGEIDTQSIPNGGAFGLAGGIGGTKSGASGYATNGSVEGEVFVVGGGAGGTDAYRFNPHLGDRSIGVGSASNAVAATHGFVKVKADPDPYFGYAEADGGFRGFAAQGTLNGSYVTGSPRFGWESEGFSGGIAGQGSIGNISGYAYARDFGDSGWIDSKAGAGAEAGIDMWGGSYSESYRYIEWDDNATTEGMGTVVGADTHVRSYAKDWDWEKGWLNKSGSGTDGRWVAFGGAATMTIQNAPGIGGAEATAVGYYVGSGALGCNFNGSANGYSQTSVTTFDNMNGSINTAGAGMSVTATNYVPRVD